jgi:hypothetical protein
VLTGRAKVDVVGVAVCLAKRPVNGGWSAANRAKVSPALATTSLARRNGFAADLAEYILIYEAHGEE